MTQSLDIEEIRRRKGITEAKENGWPLSRDQRQIEDLCTEVKRLRSILKNNRINFQL